MPFSPDITVSKIKIKIISKDMKLPLGIPLYTKTLYPCTFYLTFSLKLSIQLGLYVILCCPI